MRDITMKVTGQLLEVTGNCDGIVAGTQNYLQAVFEFSEDWDDCIKVASFWVNNRDCAVLIKDNKCIIPAEATVGRYFKVSVTGQKNGYRIVTNKVKIMQEVR